MSGTQLLRQHPAPRAILCAAFLALCASPASGGGAPADAPTAPRAGVPNHADQRSAPRSLPGFSVAQADAAEAAPQPESRASARKRTAEELAAAKARSAAADAAYSRMRRSNYPRGAAKEEILKERMEASADLAAAQAAYDALHPGGR